MGIEGGKQRLPSTDVCENDMLNYCKEMSCLLSNISVQVKAAQGKVAERFLHEVRPGDFVVIRDHRRKSWKSKRWLGPFQCFCIYFFYTIYQESLDFKLYSTNVHL